MSADGLKPLAVIVKGNPKYLSDSRVSALGDRFYEGVAETLRSRGFEVEFDAGEPWTCPSEKAAAWVGHSRGVDRLRLAPPGVRTLALETREAAGGEPDQMGLDPRHYELSDKSRRELEALSPQAGPGGPRALGDGAHLAWVCALSWRAEGEEDAAPREEGFGLFAELLGEAPSEADLRRAAFAFMSQCSRLLGSEGPRAAQGSWARFDADDPPGARGGAHFACAASASGPISRERAEAAMRGARQAALEALESLGLGHARELSEELCLGLASPRSESATRRVIEMCRASAESRELEAEAGSGARRRGAGL